MWAAASRAMVPASVTLAVLEQELPGASAFCQRQGWRIAVDEQKLQLVVDMQHPKDAQPLRLLGDLNGYRAVPPAWIYVDANSGAITPHASPSAGQVPGVGASIFINHNNGPVICAPFNRLAYSQYKGPHGDWAESSNWLSVRGPVYAARLGDMLAVIKLHLTYSPGRMG